MAKVASAPAEQRISMNPATFTQGGGLPDDLDVEVVSARFALYDYEGKSDEPALVLHVEFKQDEDAENNFHNYYSAGDKAYFVPNEDPKDEARNGLYLVKVGDRDGINGGTNCALFINSMITAGVPADLFDGDMDAIDGLGIHVNQQAQPKRSGLPTRAGQRENKTILLCTRVNFLPGEAPAKGKPAAKPTGKPTPAPAKSTPSKTAAPAASSVDDPMVEELEGHLVGLFAADGVTEMAKAKLIPSLFKLIDKTDPNRTKLLQIAGKDDVLNSLTMFSFDGKTLTQV